MPGGQSTPSKPPKVGPNLATTSMASVMVTVQGPVPEQPPPCQPSKVEPMPGVSSSTTISPSKNAASWPVQVKEQETPAGLLLTVPWPSPTLVRVSTSLGSSSNTASTSWSSSIESSQDRGPQSPS